MKRKIYSLFLLLCLIPLSLLAQKPLVTGTVTDGSLKEPLPGTTVRIKGGTTGAISDENGKYSIEAKRGDVLIFSFVGMKTVEKTVGDSNQVDMVMENDDAVMLDQVVVIGYGIAKKSHLSGAVSSLSEKELNGQVAANAATALQGKIPGVSVSSGSGNPNENMTINIRGVSSLSNNSPLYVIDGAFGDINMVDPNDIASIEVLKDAASAAIYGFRAAGGVVIITTKSGKKDTPAKLDVNFLTGFGNISKKMKMLNGEEYSRFARYYNIAGDGYGAEADGVPFVGKGTDWQDVMYNTAMTYKANMNISGGSKTGTYNLSVGYLNREGTLKNTNNESYNIRLKNDFSFLDNRLTIGESLILRLGKGNGNINDETVFGILQFPSVVPVFDSNNPGGWGVSKILNSPNPYAQSVLFKKRTDDTDLFLNAYLQAEIIKGLKYKFNVGYRREQGKIREYTADYDLGAYGTNPDPDLTESNTKFDSWVLENTLNYDRTFGKHNVSAVIGYSAQRDKTWDMNGWNTDLPSHIGTMTGNVTEMGAISHLYAVSLISQFGRVMYSYDNRYLLSASIRRDGSSRFRKGHQFGYFPSVSLGWNIDQEKFFKPLQNTFDQLKLRVSYGKLGNQDIGSYYPTQEIVSTGMNYLQGGELWMGQLPSILAVSPPDLTWENTETYNVGLDMSLWNGALSFTADAYIKNTNDVLLAVPLAPSTGIGGSSFRNAGEIRNSGIELTLNHKGKIGSEFTYYVGGNLTFEKNEVKKVTLGGENMVVSGYDAHAAGGQGINMFREGHSMSYFNLIETDGLFRSKEEIANHKDKDGNLIQPTAQVGDIRYKDYNGDGKINTDDQHDVGDALPNLFFGLRLGGEWRGIDFNAFFDGVTGNHIYNYPRYVLESGKYSGNYSTKLADSWRPDHQDTDVPRFSKTNVGDNQLAYTTRWLEDGTYFRLKTLDIGYTLPAKWLKPIKLESVRLYTSMENLFTLTKYSGYTPDLGESGTAPYTIFTRSIDQGRYPQQRTFSFGIQVKL